MIVRDRIWVGIYSKSSDVSSKFNYSRTILQDNPVLRYGRGTTRLTRALQALLRANLTTSSNIPLVRFCVGNQTVTFETLQLKFPLLVVLHMAWIFKFRFSVEL